MTTFNLLACSSAVWVATAHLFSTWCQQGGFIGFGQSTSQMASLMFLESQCRLPTGNSTEAAVQGLWSLCGFSFWVSWIPHSMDKEGSPQSDFFHVGWFAPEQKKRNMPGLLKALILNSMPSILLHFVSSVKTGRQLTQT